MKTEEWSKPDEDDGKKLRKGLGFILCLLILVGGCGDGGGGGSTTMMDPSNSPCGESATSPIKFKSKDNPKFFVSTQVGETDSFSPLFQRQNHSIFPPIEKVFKQGFLSLQQSLRDRMKAFGMMGKAMAQGGSATVSGRLSYEDREYDKDGFTGNRFPKPIR